MILDILRAGRLRRYHSNVELEGGRQTNADHSWNALSLLLYFDPEASRAVILATQYHDVGEEFDIPFPHKQRHPELKRLVDDIESLRRATLIGRDPVGLITPEERQLLKLCDGVECVAYAALTNPTILGAFGWPKMVESLREQAISAGHGVKFAELMLELSAHLRRVGIAGGPALDSTLGGVYQK